MSPFLPLLASVATAQSPPVFSNPAYLIDTLVGGFATADFDGDGRVDVAAAASPNVVLFRNVGTGLLSPLATLPVPTGAGAVAAGDLTGDGIPDLAVIGSQFPVPILSIFVGNGAGGFAPPAQFPEGQAGLDLALVDLDNNGLLDLAFANSTTAFVTVHLQASPLFLAAPQLDPTLGTEPLRVRATDANHDGWADLLVLSRSSSGTGYHEVRLGNGNGTFHGGDNASHAVFLGGNFGDFDGDGDLDLAITKGPGGGGSREVYAYAMDPQGSFALVSHTPVHDVMGAVQFAELTGDGKLDLILGCTFELSTFEVFAGDGQGLFTALGMKNYGKGFIATAVLDLDGDGHDDVLAGGSSGFSGSYGIEAYLGDGQGDFSNVGISTGNTYSVAIADLNHDGIPDVVGGGQAIPGLPAPGLGVDVRLGIGNFGFVPAAPIATSNSPLSITVGDFDQDGNSDLLLVPGAGNTFLTSTGAGDGTFAPPVAWPMGSPPNSSSGDSRVGDFTNDGRPDVLLLRSNVSGLTLVPNNPTGGFGTPAFFAAGTDSRAVAVADLDLDGNLDAVATSSDTIQPKVSVFLGDGLGGLQRVDVPAPAAVGHQISVAIGDPNEDGVPDFVVGASSDFAALFFGNGAGGWTAGAPFPGTADPVDMALTDVNRDGHADLLSVRQGYMPLLIVSLGSGTGTFAPAGSHWATGFSYTLAVGDLDADGNPDAAVANSLGKTISIFRNLSGGVPGIANYGTGTFGCRGMHGLLADGLPKVGNAGFAATCTNAPAAALGLGAYATTPLWVGADPLQIGLVLHLDFLASADTGTFDLHSDFGGNARAPLPIPNNPFLVGATYYLQAIWYFAPADACDPSPFGLSSSPGMSVTIQP